MAARRREGAAPEPELPAIREQIRERQEEWEALTRATARVLADKTAFVEKHRRRLVKEADSYASEAHARYPELVDQLADARANLAAKRSAAVWARLYPAEQAGRGPADTFAGGRKRPLQAMGLSGPVAPARVLDGLRADAEWLADAGHRSSEWLSRALTPASRRTPSGSTTPPTRRPETRQPANGSRADENLGVDPRSPGANGIGSMTTAPDPTPRTDRQKGANDGQ